MNKLRFTAVFVACFVAGSVVLVYFAGGAAPEQAHRTAESQEPRRIVSLAPNLTEILFALGLGDKVVAVSNDSDYPPEVGERKKVGTFWHPNTEAVIAARPELVVTLSFPQQLEVARVLRRLGFKVLTVQIETVEQLFVAIAQIGEAASCRKRAQALVHQIRDKVSKVRSKLSSADKVKVLWVVQAEPLRVASRNTFINELIEMAGGENVIPATVGQYPQIGGEQLLLCQAEVIIQPAMGRESIAEQRCKARLFWSKWPGLPAVRDDRIYVVEPDIVNRLGPRLAEAVELVGRCLHPELFPDTTGKNR